MARRDDVADLVAFGRFAKPALRARLASMQAVTKVGQRRLANA